MRKFKRIVAILAAAALSVTVMAGCSSNGGTSGGSDAQAVKMINIPLTNEGSTPSAWTRTSRNCWKK